MVLRALALASGGFLGEVDIMTETFTSYCKVCGHAKEHHNLDVHLDPKGHLAARDRGARGEGACTDMSFGDNHCICVEYQGWTDATS